MKPQHQLIVHDPENGRLGDCQRTCVAVVLGLNADDVPHFVDDVAATPESDQWWSKRQDTWLAARGLSYARIGYDPSLSLEQVLSYTRACPSVPWILMGQSSIGSNHVVVVRDGEIVCDPSGNGIIGPPVSGDPWELAVISVGPDL